MKKIKKLSLITFIFCIVSLICGLSVYAYDSSSELVKEAISDIYYERTKEDYYFSINYYTYDLNGETAYCIEPGVAITEETYYGASDLSVSNLDADTLRTIFLYAYYGYSYGDHTSIDYRVAAQTLIWEAVSDYTFTYHTERYGYGTLLDYSDEMAEIVELANNHYIKPSFNDKTIVVQVGEEVTMVDTNNVLEDYEVYGDNIANVVINGNELSFTATSTGNITLNFVKKSDTDVIQLINYNDVTQKMITRSAVDPVYSSLNVTVEAGQVEFYKLDYETNSSTTSGEATLMGAEYGIYDLSGNLIETLVTNDDGYAISSRLSETGTYYLQEITPSEGYTLDETKYYFESSIDDLLVSLELYEKVITREVEITKVFVSNTTGIMTPEPDVEFGFYDVNDELIITDVTDENGRIEVDLPYGSYTVKQLTTTLNYEYADDFIVNITEEGGSLIYVISNAEINAKLKVIKVDEDTNEIIPISGIKFRIYDVDNEEYVCQSITYPTNSTVCEFETDESGTLITPYALSNGNYLLEEVDQSIDGYLWNNVSVEFEVGVNSNIIYDDELGPIIEISFTNKEVKGEIKITKLGEEFIVEDGNFYYETILLSEVEFGLYAYEDIYTSYGELVYLENELVTTGITDEFGVLLFENLYLGNYYLIELETNENYVLDDSIYIIELSYIDQYTETIKYEITIENHLKKGTLEFTKVDSVSSDTIPNTKIEVYTEFDELIYTGITDEDGKVIIEDLYIGNYYIVETEPSEGYLLSEEIIEFEITEDGQIVEKFMTNQFIIIDVPITEKNVVPYNVIIILSMVTIGIGLIVYAKKKK